MNNELNLELSEIRRKKFINNNIKINNVQNKLDAEENKGNAFLRNYLFNLKNKTNHFLNKSRNNKLKPIYLSRFDNNDSIINKIKFRINQKSTNDTLKDKSEYFIPKNNILSRNLSILNKPKIKTKFNSRNFISKNKSSSYIFEEKNQIFPLIKPRKILINIYSGPYEYKIKDINKKSLCFKKFGKNSIFMGEKYNPKNYEIKEKIKIGINHLGTHFAN